MSTVVTQPVSYRPDQRNRLERLRAMGVLVLLVAFVLASGHRVLEDRDEAG